MSDPNVYAAISAADKAKPRGNDVWVNPRLVAPEDAAPPAPDEPAAPRSTPATAPTPVAPTPPENRPPPVGGGNPNAPSTSFDIEKVLRHLASGRQ